MAYPIISTPGANQNTGSATAEGIAAIEAKAAAARAAAFADPLANSSTAANQVYSDSSSFDSSVQNSNTTTSSSPPPLTDPTSASAIGTGYTSRDTIEAKIRTLHKIGKTGAARTAQNLFQTSASLPPNNNGPTSLDDTTQRIIRSIFSAELKIHNTISKEANSIATGIGNLTTTINNDFQIAKDDIHNALQPISSHTGQALAAATGVLRDPFGSAEAVGRSIGHLIDKVNPGFTDRMEASFKKSKVDSLKHLPTTIMGGLRSLASTVDAILAFPLSIAADLYNGLMEIVQQISELLNSVVSGIFDLIFGPKGLLDSLLPIADILDFLSAVGEVASFAGSITGAFSGLSMVTNVIGQVGSFSSLGIGALSNPVSLATSFLPPGATQFTSGLRNPQQFLSNIVPPNVQSQLGKIGQLPGLGFVGNMGYNLGGALQQAQGGIAEGLLNKYSSQAGVLGSLLGKPSQHPPATDTTQPHLPTIEGSSVNPSLPVVPQHGTRVYPQPKPLVLAEKQTSNSGVLPPSPLGSINQPSTFKYSNPLTPQAATYSL